MDGRTRPNEQNDIELECNYFARYVSQAGRLRAEAEIRKQILFLEHVQLRQISNDRTGPGLSGPSLHNLLPPFPSTPSSCPTVALLEWKDGHYPARVDNQSSPPNLITCLTACPS